jgi:predicted RNA polymerase sigma factor
MLLTEARREARVGERGEMVTLPMQDRSLWDQRLVADGDALVKQALATGPIGEYQLQAAIAAVHMEASRSAAQRLIAGLYTPERTD